MSNTTKKIIIVVCAAVFATVYILVAGRKAPEPAAPVTASAGSGKQARIKTRHGDMVLKLYSDVAPKTVKNFCDLTAKGFYNGVIFHRVIKGFMIQGGDPEGTGMGGPGYTIPAEFNPRPHKRGALSMARSQDPNSAGSQFFIVHQDSRHLDNQYTVFGELVSGFEVLDKIAEAPVQGDRPLDPIKMDSVTLEDAK
jgi:peptidyl-prolyl cis-trans isomerase B (cyclophilin B)